VHNRTVFLEWLVKYGNDKIILGADSNNRMIATNGWQQQSDMDIINFIKEYEKKGVSYVICTDISKDGMLQGPSTELYNEILSKINIKLIASGGVTSIEDIKLVQQIGCEGAIIGKAIYEGRISLRELELFIINGDD
jgi:phosphoribosylformimino-5-aminoimidazole carboxamide ribotide isomerase